MGHNRLGHPNAKVIQKVLSLCNILTINKDLPDFCNACCLGMHHKFPFLDSTTEYTKPLELIHLDLWGPSPVLSYNGYKYYVYFVDSFSRFTWVYLLKNISDALQTFINFRTQVELQIGCSIKKIQTTWGGEYQAFTNYLESNGIIYRVACPRTHEQNGLVEHKHRYIIKTTLTLLAHASLPL